MWVSKAYLKIDMIHNSNPSQKWLLSPGSTQVVYNLYTTLWFSRKANPLMASLVKPWVMWFFFENVDIFVGHGHCRTKISFIYIVEIIEASYIVFFSTIITSTICLLDLCKNGRLLLKCWWFTGWPLDGMSPSHWNKCKYIKFAVEWQSQTSHCDRLYIYLTKSFSGTCFYSLIWVCVSF